MNLFQRTLEMVNDVKFTCVACGTEFGGFEGDLLSRDPMCLKCGNAKRAMEQDPSANWLAETDDYFLIASKLDNQYHIVNKATEIIEYRECKLPTCLYQIDALQAALDKLDGVSSD